MTILCPSCGNVGASRRPIAPGKKIRCLKCRTEFKLGSPLNGLSKPMFLSEMFDKVSEKSYQGSTNKRIMNDEGTVIEEPASRRSKDYLISSNRPPVRFEEPRQYMAVLLVFLLLVFGYASAVCFNQFWNYYSDAARLAEDYRKTSANPNKAAKARKTSKKVVNHPEIRHTLGGPLPAGR